MSVSTDNSPSDVTCPPTVLPIQSYHSNYHSISNIGNGSFGTVELAKYKHAKEELLSISMEKRGTLLDPLVDSHSNLTGLVAIKTMKKRLSSLHDYSRVKEVKFILSISSHPCLVQVYEMFIDDVKFQLHISMESLNQNLYQLMKARRSIHFSPVTLRSILSQVLCAIGHIHKHNYFHRDVKPENILVIPSRQYYGSKDAIPPHRKNDNFVVKLADYGLARHIHNSKPYTAYVSTRWYRSPEILLRQNWYSKPIDIWAFGSVAAEVANFAPLFPGNNELDQIWRILRTMGTPISPDVSTQPFRGSSLGGYWKDAQTLAGKLGFVLPHEPGCCVQDILPDPQHAELSEVVVACLSWDPNTRPTFESIASMPYFKNTILSVSNKEPERRSNILVRPKDLSKNGLNMNSNLRPYEANRNNLKPIKVTNFSDMDRAEIHEEYRGADEVSVKENISARVNLDTMPPELSNAIFQHFDGGSDEEAFDDDDNDDDGDDGDDDSDEDSDEDIYNNSNESEENDKRADDQYEHGHDSKMDIHFREYLENSKTHQNFKYSWSLKAFDEPKKVPKINS